MSYRAVCWLIVGMLFVSTAISSVDRQTRSILSRTLRQGFHLTEAGYANAVTAFLAAYTVMYTLSGCWLDRVGVRLGMAVCIKWWSLATMLTAFAPGALSLAAFRFLLGVGEPGVFPAGLKACAEWFRKSERTLPTGFLSSGNAVGAVLAPPLVAWITLQFGWRFAFLLPGAVGLLWIPAWWLIYRRPSEHAALRKDEIAGLAGRIRIFGSAVLTSLTRSARRNTSARSAGIVVTRNLHTTVIVGDRHIFGREGPCVAAQLIEGGETGT